MPLRAALFDLGNTLVSYYKGPQFPPILRQSLAACLEQLNPAGSPIPDDLLFRQALEFNREQADFAVWPMRERLASLFPACADDPELCDRLTAAFLRPIFATAVPDPDARYVLEALRKRGIRTAIVSNTPWGSPAADWRKEAARHSLFDAVDATVFCVDVGYRKPHPAPMLKALELLEVSPAEAIFVGDDPRWDVIGAQRSGIRPVLLTPEGGADLPTDVTVIRRLRDVLELEELTVPNGSSTRGPQLPHRNGPHELAQRV